nr:ABC transporter substrate-binding protein [Pseudomonas sp.]
MKLSTRLVSIGAALLVSLPATAFELVDSNGTVKLPNTPNKIVSFDLSALDTLNTLGVPVVGVPKLNYEGRLATFNETTVVGTLFEPDYAVLKTVQPDLIIAGGRSQKAVPQLQDVAPTASFESDPSAFLKSFKAANLALAGAFGKEAQARDAISAIDRNVEELHRVNDGKKGAFLFVIKGNVMTHVPGDRFGYAFELTGLDSVLPAKDTNLPAQPRPEAGSPEAKAAAEKRAQDIVAIAKAEPDWLIVLDRGAINGGEKTAAATLASHPQLSQTRAFKEGRVYYADPNGWYVVGGGLSNLKGITEDMLAQMKK